MYKVSKFIIKLLFTFLWMPCFLSVQPLLFILSFILSKTWEEFKQDYFGVNKMLLEPTIIPVKAN